MAKAVRCDRLAPVAVVGESHWAALKRGYDGVYCGHGSRLPAVESQNSHQHGRRKPLRHPRRHHQSLADGPPNATPLAVYVPRMYVGPFQL